MDFARLPSCVWHSIEPDPISGVVHVFLRWDGVDLDHSWAIVEDDYNAILREWELVMIRRPLEAESQVDFITHQQVHQASIRFSIRAKKKEDGNARKD